MEAIGLAGEDDREEGIWGGGTAEGGYGCDGSLVQNLILVWTQM